MNKIKKKKKRKIIFALSVCAAVGFISAAAYADSITVYVNDEPLYTDVEPINENGRVLVPMRAIFEQLGASVEWVQSEQTAWAKRDGEFYCLPIGNTTMSMGIVDSWGNVQWVDKKTLDVPAKVINDRTMVPVRAVSEALRADVYWDGEGQSVYVSVPQEPEGWIYYPSKSDGNKLYAIDSNGQNRCKLSDMSCYDIQFHQGYIYFFTYDDPDKLYRIKADGTEDVQKVCDDASYPVGFYDGVYYYMIKSDEYPDKSGYLYKVNGDGEYRQQLSAVPIQNASMYRDRIYYNEFGDDRLYTRNTDGSDINAITLGDDILFSPFNCMFYGDFILMSNGVYSSRLERLSLDGRDRNILNQIPTNIAEEQQINDTILFTSPDSGQDIYAINADGSNMRKIVDVDSSWFDVKILDQYGEWVYYKNAYRMETFRVRSDGADNKQVAWARELKAFKDKIFYTSDNALYFAELDGSGSVKIADINAGGLKIDKSYIYFSDKKTGKLYRADENGYVKTITNEAVDIWVSD